MSVWIIHAPSAGHHTLGTASPAIGSPSLPGTCAPKVAASDSGPLKIMKSLPGTENSSSRTSSGAFYDVLDWRRPGEKVSLCLVGAVFAQQVQCFGTFDALGDCCETVFLRDSDD
jgi:hypothetical protein